MKILNTKDGVNVFSAFDGISGGQFTLKKLGIHINKYYASEIEPNAIAITQQNFPNTIQLGDIKNIKGKDLDTIHLLIGGSPCQSLSIASRSKESGLVSGKSTIFYEYVRLLKEVKPIYFLLENVASMKKKDKDEISKELGVEPVLINSKNFSGQLRSRLYWTNIPQDEMPQKEDIKLSSLLDNAYSERDKSYCITATYNRACAQDYFLFGQRQMVFKKPVTVEYKSEYISLINDDGKEYKEKRKIAYFTTQGKTYRLDKKDKNSALQKLKINEVMRKLSPVECEKLQCLDFDYTKYGLFNGKKKEIKTADRYHSIGNGWTISVIQHVMKRLKEL